MTYRPVVAEGRCETLAEMMFFIERFTLTRAWNGLTDDEFLWEPMPGCWTVRPVEETRTPTPFVVGAWAADFDASLAAATTGATDLDRMALLAHRLHAGSDGTTGLPRR